MNTPGTPAGLSEKDIFLEALQKATPEARAAYLDEACARNPTLRARIEALLANHFQPTEFMQNPAVDAAGLTQPSTPASDSPAILIGRYKLLEKIGEGGFGEVWMAEQREPVKRRVALKILKPGMDSRQIVARFEAERQALALMDHPNIARIFDAGATEGGRPYFVMELVRGTKITEYCDQHQLTTPRRLNLFILVCQAIQHAHQKGIIHRDIKPSNVLVTVNDGAPVPKVIDFGIAKATQAELTDKTVFTQFQQFIGTPAYISPEQAEMSSLDIDTRADIYSLGVLLYELLVGQTPFDAREMMQGGFDALRRIIREREPQRPSTRLNTLPGDARTTAGQRRQTDAGKLVHQLQGDLDWIVMKCLEKDRTRRYDTANGLAADLRRHLDNEPVVARPPSTAYRIQKAIRRNKLAFGAAAATGNALLAGLMVASFGWRQSQQERDRALVAEAQAVAAKREAEAAQQGAEASRQTEREQRQRAEKGEADSRLQLYAANMNLARQAWDQGNTRRLRRLLEETRNSEYRGFEWYYWQRQARPGLKTFRGHSDTVTSVAYSPDGKRVATASDDGTAKIWDVASGRELFALTKHSKPVKSVEFSQDARRLVTSSLDSTIRIWDADTGVEQLILLGHTNQVLCAAFSPDGRRLVSGGVDRTVRIWSAETGQEIRNIPVQDGLVMSVAISPEGDRILSAHEDGSAIVWDLAGGNQLMALEGHQGLISSSAFSPDGRRIATTSIDGTTRVWDAAESRELLKLPTRAFSLEFSPDGQRIATAGENGAVRIWDAATGALEQTLEGGEAMLVAFSPDGRQLITGNVDATARLWDVAHRRAPSRSKPLRGMDSVATFSPDRQRFVSGGTGNTATVWEVGSGQELTNFIGHSAFVVQAKFSPDGERVATAGWDHSTKVWEAATGREQLTLRGHRAPVYSVAFSPDGRRLATGGADGTIRYWDARSGAALLELYGHRDGVYCMDYSPDGNHLATGGENGTVMIWSAVTGEELLQMSDLKGAVWGLDFSTDRERLVASTFKGSTGVWRVSDGSLEVILEESRPSSAVVFSPDGRRIVTAGVDRTVRVWDATSGKQLTSFPVSGADVDGVAFSPDGRRLLGADKKGQTQIWEAATPDQVAAWDAEERADQERLIQQQTESEAEKQATAANEERELVLRAGLTALPRPHQTATRRHPVAPGDPGAIRRWLILAPFPFVGDCRVHTLLEQIPGEARLRPRAGERPADAPSGLKWTPTELTGPFYLLDFLGTVAPGNPDARMDNHLGYAVAYIQSDSPRTNLTLLVGSDDTARLYLNEQEVYRQLKPRPCRLDEDEVRGISLKAGINVLVFKVVNAVGFWSGSVRLIDADGSSVKGIRVLLDPDRTN